MLYTLTMTEQFSFTVSRNNHGERLDSFLTQELIRLKPEISRNRIKQLVNEEYVKSTNGKIYNRCSYKIKEGQEFNLVIPPAESTDIEAKNIPLDIAFEDEHMLVVNKQAGLTTHPGAGNYDNTLVNALMNHCGDSLSGINGEIRPGIVHRLDKDTSGLMVVAKTDLAHKVLAEEIGTRELKRNYLCFVWGVPKPESGVIETDITRHRIHRQKMTVVTSGNGKFSRTNYKVIEKFGNSLASLVECKLDTGRTHQIRVHMSHIGCPLIGDQLYCRSKNKVLAKIKDETTRGIISDFNRQALHSYKIAFRHPINQEWFEFDSELPQDMQTLLQSFRDL